MFKNSVAELRKLEVGTLCDRAAHVMGWTPPKPGFRYWTLPKGIMSQSIDLMSQDGVRLIKDWFSCLPEAGKELMSDALDEVMLERIGPGVPYSPAFEATPIDFVLALVLCEE